MLLLNFQNVGESPFVALSPPSDLMWILGLSLHHRQLLPVKWAGRDLGVRRNHHQHSLSSKDVVKERQALTSENYKVQSNSRMHLADRNGRNNYRLVKY